MISLSVPTPLETSMASSQLAAERAVVFFPDALHTPPFRLTGVGLIVLGVGLNIPFALLGATFNYPNILREPTADILTRFQAGGAGLIATWYAFMEAALLFVPISVVV